MIRYNTLQSLIPETSFNNLFEFIFTGTKKTAGVSKVKRKGGQNVTIGGKVVGKTTKGNRFE